MGTCKRSSHGTHVLTPWCTPPPKHTPCKNSYPLSESGLRINASPSWEVWNCPMATSWTVPISPVCPNLTMPAAEATQDIGEAALVSIAPTQLASSTWFRRTSTTWSGIRESSSYPARLNLGLNPQQNPAGFRSQFSPLTAALNGICNHCYQIASLKFCCSEEQKNKITMMLLGDTTRSRIRAISFHATLWKVKPLTGLFLFLRRVMAWILWLRRKKNKNYPYKSRTSTDRRT